MLFLMSPHFAHVAAMFIVATTFDLGGLNLRPYLIGAWTIPGFPSDNVFDRGNVRVPVKGLVQ